MQNSILKERERVRLKRTVNAVFPFRKYELFWSDKDYSYYDGVNLFTHYEIRSCDPAHPGYSEVELRILRMAHSFHERGHMEFDNITDYNHFLKENSSPNKEDWEESIGKYPIELLRWHANWIVDGRMLNLTEMKYPYTKSYLDFDHQFWKTTHPTHTNIVDEYHTSFARRCLGMNDEPSISDDVIHLLNSVQPYFDQARIALSTYDCLSTFKEMFKLIWPTLLKWHKEENIAIDAAVSRQEVHRHDDSIWESVQMNANELAELLAGHKPDQESQLAFDDLINKIKREIVKDEEQGMPIIEGLTPQMIEIQISTKKQAYSDSVRILPFESSDLTAYNQLAESVRPQTFSTIKSLKTLLQPVDDQTLSRQRSGKLNPSQIWRGVTHQDITFFTRNLNGEPTKGVRLGIMADISGSTQSNFNASSTVIHEIKKCLVMIAEATNKLGIPTCMYAFTETDTTDIYPLKPFNGLTVQEKSWIGGLAPRSGNRDTLALQYLIDQLIPYPSEEIKVIFIISDGQPCFTSNENETTILDIVKQAEKKGIYTICLYCGPDDQRILNLVKFMYPGGAIHVTSDMSQQLTKRLKRIILNHA